MRKWILATTVAVALASVLLLPRLSARQVVSVRVRSVESAQVEATITNSKAGTVRARRRAKLSPEVAGRVVEVPFREGDHVKRGDVVVALSDASQRAELVYAEHALAAAEAARAESMVVCKQTERDLQRTRELAGQEIVSDVFLERIESAYLRARATCRTRGAELAEARAAIGIAKAQVEKTLIRAPFDGVIAELDVQVGEWITSESPYLEIVPAIDIIDPTSVYVSAPMDEVDAARIRKGQRAKISLDSHPDESFAGRVVRVAPYVLDVEAQNRTVEIEVELDDPQVSASLLPGTSADVEVILDVREDVLRIPTSALLAGKRVLLVVDGRLVDKEVEIGLKNWDYAEVVRGLERGQHVVVSLDRRGVEPGARVEVEVASPRP